MVTRLPRFEPRVSDSRKDTRRVLEMTDLELSRWRQESAHESGRVITWMALTIGATLSAAFGLQWLVLDHGSPEFAHLARALPAQIAILFATAAAFRHSAWVRARGLAFSLTTTLLVGAMGGVVLGGLGGFDGPHFYSVYMMPAFIMLIPLSPLPRVAATLAMISCFTACFVWQRGAVDPPHLDITASTLLMMSSVCILMGHRGWALARERFVVMGRLAREHALARSQNVALADRLRGQARRAEALARELDDAALAARASLARDLHDDVGQILVGARLELERLDRQLGSGERLGVAQLDRLQGVMGGLEDGIRDMISRLREAEAPTDLRAAIDELIAPFRDDYDVTLELDTRVLGELDEGSRGVLYRVIQEGLTNAAKHSGAPGRWVTLSREEDAALLTVVDDGPDPLPSDFEHGGWGLLGLRERVESLGGTLSLSRSRGRTLLRAILPLHHAAQLSEAAS
jgi:signal transduction histidine kinase